MKEMLMEHIDSCVMSYGNGSVGYETVCEELKMVESIADINQALNDIDEIMNSKTEFVNALQCIENEDYVYALFVLEKITEKDTENYNESKEKFNSIYNIVLSEIEKDINEESYFSAYNTVKKLEELSYNYEGLAELKDRVLMLYTQKLISEAQEMFDKGNYADAYKYVNALTNEFLVEELNTIKSNSKEKFVENELAKAKEKNDLNKYDEAISILTTANSKISDTRFTNKIKEYKAAKNTAIINSYKSEIAMKYDSIEKIYFITSKGLEPGYYTINDYRNIQAIIEVEDKRAEFFLFIGFWKDSWIFMDEIIIDCDETQYKISVDYFDRKTQISGGDIMEAYYLIDGTGYNKQFMKLEPVINSMNNANNVTIRFKGDEGTLDKVIPKSHITEIYTLWQVYNVLNEDPTLVSKLQ